MGDKCKLMQPKEPRVGDKGETSVKSCGPRHPEWETSAGDKCGRQVGDKCKFMRPKEPRVRDMCGRQGGDKCKLMRPKEPRVGDKCERQVWETSGGDKWETSVKTCAPRHPEWETSVGDKWKTSGRQV